MTEPQKRIDGDELIRWLENDWMAWYVERGGAHGRGTVNRIAEKIKAMQAETEDEVGERP